MIERKKEKKMKEIPNQSKQEWKKRETPPNKLSLARTPFKKIIMKGREEEKNKKNKKCQHSQLRFVLQSTYSIDFFKDDVKSN